MGGPGSKKKKRTGAPAGPTNRPNEGRAHIGFYLVQLLSALVERFGWPGALFIVGFWFVDKYATADQKVRIIETYILGAGIGHMWPIVVESCIFALVLLAQRAVYQRHLLTKQGEIDRLAKWKTDHQHERIGTSLHSSDPRELGK